MKSTPAIKRFGRPFAQAFLLALALSIAMALLYWRGAGPREFVEVVLGISIMWTIIFLSIHYFSSMFSDYVRITDEAVIREPVTSNRKIVWRFDQTAGFRLLNKQAAGLSWRSLALVMLSGEDVEITLSPKASNEKVREALEGKLVEIPTK